MKLLQPVSEQAHKSNTPIMLQIQQQSELDPLRCSNNARSGRSDTTLSREMHFLCILVERGLQGDTRALITPRRGLFRSIDSLVSTDGKRTKMDHPNKKTLSTLQQRVSFCTAVDRLLYVVYVDLAKSLLMKLDI